MECAILTGIAATERAILVRRAFVLGWLTVAWMTVEGTVALSSGMAAHSLTLSAFGTDSIIELLSAGVLLWRLRRELLHGQEFSEDAEQFASRVGGGLLFLLAAYIVAGAGWSVWTRRGEDFSVAGLVICCLAMPIMFVLARGKLALAAQLGSRAIRTDAIESITCGWLSLVVVAGLAANRLFGVWWIDAATSLAVVGYVVKEAREAWNHDSCCDD